MSEIEPQTRANPDLAAIARRLSQAEAALDRIEQGEFDRCPACGGPIDQAARELDALAERCSSCSGVARAGE